VGDKGHQAFHDFWGRLNCSQPRALITHGNSLVTSLGYGFEVPVFLYTSSIQHASCILVVIDSHSKTSRRYF